MYLHRTSFGRRQLSLSAKLVAGAIATAATLAASAAQGAPRDGDAEHCADAGTIVGLNASAGGALNVRSGPGRGNKVRGRLKLGDAVRICSTKGDWAEIAYANGKTGWIFKPFVRIDAAAETENEPPTAALPSQSPSQPAVKKMPTPSPAAPSARAAPAPQALSTPARTGAYGRRDYKLGMRLAEFRRQAYPDSREVPGVVVVCSGDDEASMRGYDEVQISTALAKAGVTKCVHYHMLDFGLSKAPLAAGLGLGGNLLTTDFYFLAPDDGNDKRLFWIETRGPTNVADRLMPSFVEEYGLPSEERTEPWWSKSGAKFDNTIRVWKNDVSEVEFRRLGSTLNGFELVHRLTAMRELLDRRLSGRTASAVKRT